MYLLDTNVVSELRRVKPHGAVLTWLATIPPADLFISAISLGEIQIGIERARLTDPDKADAISAWADMVVATFNVLPLGADIFRLWARLMAGKSSDYYEDALIAATAINHRLVLVTRNTKDFQMFGMQMLNPFEFRQSF